MRTGTNTFPLDNPRRHIGAADSAGTSQRQGHELGLLSVWSFTCFSLCVGGFLWDSPVGCGLVMLNSQVCVYSALYPDPLQPKP